MLQCRNDAKVELATEMSTLEVAGSPRKPASPKPTANGSSDHVGPHDELPSSNRDSGGLADDGSTRDSKKKKKKKSKKNKRKFEALDTSSSPVKRTAPSSSTSTAAAPPPAAVGLRAARVAAAGEDVASVERASIGAAAAEPAGRVTQVMVWFLSLVRWMAEIRALGAMMHPQHAWSW